MKNAKIDWETRLDELKHYHDSAVADFDASSHTKEDTEELEAKMLVLDTAHKRFDEDITAAIAKANRTLKLLTWVGRIVAIVLTCFIVLGTYRGAQQIGWFRAIAYDLGGVIVGYLFPMLTANVMRRLKKPMP